MRKPETRGAAQQKASVESLRLRKRAEERQDEIDASRREEVKESEAEMRRRAEEAADPESSGTPSCGGRKGYDEP